MWRMPVGHSSYVHLHPEVDHDLHSLMNQIKETSPTLASRDLQSRLSSGCGSMSTAGHCLCSVRLACAVWPCERHSPSLGFRSLLTLGSTSATCSASRQAVPGQQLLYNTWAPAPTPPLREREKNVTLWVTRTGALDAAIRSPSLHRGGHRDPSAKQLPRPHSC